MRGKEGTARLVPDAELSGASLKLAGYMALTSSYRELRNYLILIAKAQGNELLCTDRHPSLIILMQLFLYMASIFF
jgi:hypothetical protein